MYALKGHYAKSHTKALMHNFIGYEIISHKIISHNIKWNITKVNREDGADQGSLLMDSLVLTKEFT